MEKETNQILPKVFFSQSRPTISSNEALKDVVPIKWSKDVLNGNIKTVVNSATTIKK